MYEYVCLCSSTVFWCFQKNRKHRESKGTRPKKQNNQTKNISQTISPLDQACPKPKPNQNKHQSCDALCRSPLLTPSTHCRFLPEMPPWCVCVCSMFSMSGDMNHNHNLGSFSLVGGQSQAQSPFAQTFVHPDSTPNDSAVHADSQCLRARA